MSISEQGFAAWMEQIEREVDAVEHKEPQPIAKIVVTNTYKNDRAIHFSAAPEIAAKLTEFGIVINVAGDSYYIRVSGRFDFDAVLDYIKGLG